MTLDMAKKLVEFIEQKAMEMKLGPDDVISATSWVFCKAVSQVQPDEKHKNGYDESFMEIMRGRMLKQIKEFRAQS